MCNYWLTRTKQLERKDVTKHYWIPMRMRRHYQEAVPEELVEVAMLHVLEHHNKRIALHTHSVERDDVLVLQIGQQLGLTMEVLPGVLAGLFQCLQRQNVYKYNKYTERIVISMLTSKLN